jgi:2-amino-4-hydroxy-6-hydroxymethyldihydropteridine diphosphokinase
MTVSYIGVGSNLGNRHRYIDSAISALGSTEGIRIRRVSSIYETEPVGGPPQGRYLNGVIEIETSLRPRGLLEALNRIETALGRARGVKDSPRTIDLDILYYGDEEVKEAGLVIPHPRIREREFVLKGLRELGK